MMCYVNWLLEIKTRPENLPSSLSRLGVKLDLMRKTIKKKLRFSSRQTPADKKKTEKESLLHVPIQKMEKYFFFQPFEKIKMKMKFSKIFSTHTIFPPTHESLLSFQRSRSGSENLSLSYDPFDIIKYVPYCACCAVEGILGGSCWIRCYCY